MGPSARGRMGADYMRKHTHSEKCELFGSICPSLLFLQEVHRYYDGVGRDR